jgi:hypothetical protein
LLIGGLMLAGFFAQVALDVISLGVEHGHSHSLRGRMPVGVVIGVMFACVCGSHGIGRRPWASRSGIAKISAREHRGS